VEIKVNRLEYDDYVSLYQKYEHMKPSELLEELINYIKACQMYKWEFNLPTNTIEDLTIILFKMELQNTELRHMKEVTKDFQWDKGKNPYTDKLEI